MPGRRHKKKTFSFSQLRHPTLPNLFIIFLMGAIMGYLFSEFQNSFLVSFPTYSSQVQICLSSEERCEEAELTIIDKTKSEILLKINPATSSNILSSLMLSIHNKNLIELLIREH